MERVILVVLSILVACSILVGASYGAFLLGPYLEDVPTNWILAVTSAMILMSIFLICWRKRHTREEIPPAALKYRSL